ncbi:esterase/lipase [Desulfosporosinus orientis DSM 765]|uniref:Esterase/lipase n=1 Tax=Desulfosporosinus orientis (strain ATCC 19365 / DSM 765 / NCIMB 8382 / VKM B-1628 / Singapore I) TaxID=768706 RepID=G7WG97_DESOD|nr:alpha/beta fold hydrolase [Desulfosporosinus orientis]AET70829.1 esterase/lipase [Desulfosporosinus orientis DSM 765]
MDPQQHLVEPFYFPGNRLGCLLIHGFSGSSSEMRWMGERLAEFGWSVLGIQLSGHGTTPEEMAKTCWADWARDAENGLNELRKTCDTVIGIGLSMGGLLVLHLATLGLIHGLVAMNAPMVLADRRTRFVGLIKPFIKFVNKPGSRSKTSSLGLDPDRERFVYDRIPVEALVSLNRGIRQVRSKLHLISCPSLIMQSRKDYTVNPISMEIIKEKIKQVNPLTYYWEKSGHILTLGQEREEVIKKIHEFLDNHIL